MREILFRGKRKDNGQWVYGSLLQSKPSSDGIRMCWIKEPTCLMLGALSTPTDNFHEVHPETVGEYTNQKDIDGLEIFEGDICLREDGEKCHIIFYANSWCMDMSPFYPNCKEGWCETIKGNPKLIILGTIHDRKDS